MSATLGIDLASKPRSTALCLIEWAAGRAAVRALWRGVAGDGITPLHDELLASAIRGDWGGGLQPCSKIALDAPLGWPVDFVRALRAPEEWPVELDHDRKRLERRATDHWIHDRTKKQPLSAAPTGLPTPPCAQPAYWPTTRAPPARRSTAPARRV